MACVSLPRFRLRCAAESQGIQPEPLLLRPSALLPGPGLGDEIQEASSAAEASGVTAGMAVAEATARRPDILLLPPAPDLVARKWEAICSALEQVGARVDAPSAGKAYFLTEELRPMLGGRGGLVQVTRMALRRLRVVATLGIAPTRFCAAVAARRAEDVRTGAIFVPAGVGARGFLAPFPVSTLTDHVSGPGSDGLADRLSELGIHSLGDLAALPPDAIADGFGHAGTYARHLAAGGGSAIRPRTPRVSIAAEIDLPAHARNGPAMKQALAVLVGRLLSDRGRDGRTFRMLTTSASLVDGGHWQRSTRLRRATSDEDTLLAALGSGLGEIPAPADWLRLSVDALGPPADGRGQTALDLDGGRKRASLREALRHASAVLGSDKILRALEIDPDSPLPERRIALVPYGPGLRR